MYLTQPLHRALRMQPDAIATINGERQLTWRETADRVARFAGALQQLGVKPGDRVAMFAPNSDVYLHYLLATVWAGGVFNPVNIRWSATEVAFSLDDCDTRILIADDMFLEQAREACARATIPVLLVRSGEGPGPTDLPDVGSLIDAASPASDAGRRGSDLAGVLYTGGTTGRPKGVMLSHNNLMSSALSYAGMAEAAPQGVGLLVAPMFHVGCLTSVFGNLINGCRMVFLPGFVPKLTLTAIERHQVNNIFLVPTMLQMLLEHVDFSGSDLSTLRTVTYGASPITDALLDRAMAALPNVGYSQAYGMTELSPVATQLRPSEHCGEHRTLGRHRSAGRATMITEVKIVDPDDNEVSVGETGEIVVRGPNMMMGYWNRPEDTAEALRGGWMHTGDAGRMDVDGYVYVVDRIKDMIITGGENVYSAEVESALSTHPAVASVAVVGRPDMRWGETVHAVVCLREDAAATGEELAAWCRERIAGYKTPRSFEFREALPLSATGKVLKNGLRDDIRAK